MSDGKLSAPRSSGRRALVEGSMWGAGVLLVAALVGLVNYFGHKYYARWDWTETRLYSLSERTLDVLAGLDRDVEATMLLQPGTQLYAPTKEVLERYAAKSDRVTARVLDPEKNLVEVKRLVDEFGLTSLDVVVFESDDERRVVEASALAEFDYSGLQYGGSPTMTGFKGEAAFTSAIQALVERRKPTVRFTAGHGERSLDGFDDDGMGRIAELLGKENLELETWESLGQPDVPEGTDLLVVAGPRVNFVPPELEAFGRYLDGGGRMLVLLDPELGPDGGLVETGLESWLAGRGVDVGSDLVIDPGATLPFFGAETIFVRAASSHPITASLQQAGYPVIVSFARSVRAGTMPAGFAARTLLDTSAEGWGERDLANLRAVAKDDDDLAGPVAVAVAVAPEEEDDGVDAEDLLEPEAPADAPEVDAAAGWRLVVVGDSDFASNAQLAQVGNPTLLANAFNWLLERDDRLGIGPKTPEQVRLTLGPGELRAITLGTLVGMPLLAIVAGVLVWRRRRR